MKAYVCFTLCDIQLDLYCMISYFVVCISNDGFHIYVHRSLEDTLNMNMNMNHCCCHGHLSNHNTQSDSSL
jgi:hypothetical protein